MASYVFQSPDYANGTREVSESGAVKWLGNEHLYHLHVTDVNLAGKTCFTSVARKGLFFSCADQGKQTNKIHTLCKGQGS